MHWNTTSGWVGSINVGLNGRYAEFAGLDLDAQADHGRIDEVSEKRNPGRVILDNVLAAGFDRRRVYVTNAVKHFKFEPRGKRRMHKSPDRPEIEACKWWLERELAVVKPELVVALGGTAGQALYGRTVRVLSERGRISQDPRGFRLMLTVHPSMVLRVPDVAKEQAFADLPDCSRLTSTAT